MASKVEICNKALLLLSQKTIESFEEDTNEARSCMAFYEASRDMCLQVLLPNFAIRRTSELAAATTPAWGFTFAFAVPQDCIVVLDVKHNEDLPNGGWRVESRQVLVNHQTKVQLRYVSNNEVEGLMDAAFVLSLAALMASQMAYTLTNAASKVESMMKLHEFWRKSAMSQYGQESSTQQITNTQLTAFR